MFKTPLLKLLPFVFPEIWRKKTVSYFLKKYLGHFLSENVTLDQLTLDLNNGKGSITDLNLDVEAINGLLEDVPLEVMDGYIYSIEVIVPWGSILKDCTMVEIRGLELTVKPKRVQSTAAFLETMSMLSSMSMSSSLQLARECLQAEQAPKVEEPAEQLSPFEGIQMFAQTIESILAHVKVILVDTVIRLEHLDPDQNLGVGLEMKIDRLEYFDDQAITEDHPSPTGLSMGTAEPDKKEIIDLPAILTKNFHAMGVTITLDNFRPRGTAGSTGVSDSLGNSPSMYVSTLSSVHPSISCVGQCEDSVIQPVPVATVVGKSMVKFKIKQKESLSGPKLGLDCQLGALHVLLSPQQLHGLLELVKGCLEPSEDVVHGRQKHALRKKPMDEADFERVQQELKRQLVEERRRRQGLSPPPSLDDHLISVAGENGNGEEVFYSMSAVRPTQAGLMDCSMTSINTADTSSTQATSTFPHSDMASQVKKSPLSTPRKHKDHSARLLSDPSAEMSRYSVKMSMISVCLLHQDPKPDYRIGAEESSVGRMKRIANDYLRQVRAINFTGHILPLRDIRDKVSKALPLDHLCLLGKPLSLECIERTLHTSHSYSLELTLHSAELVECLFDRRDGELGSVSFTADSDIKLPQYSELLTFPNQDAGERTPHGSFCSVTPAAKASFLFTSKTGPFGCISSETRVSLDLGPLVAELDITIIDRLTELLYPSTPHHSASHSSVFAQTGTNVGGLQFFDQAMDDVSSAKDTVLEVTVFSPQACLHVRFPVPDLRSSTQLAPRQWWRRNLHKEILLLEVQNLRMHTGLSDASQGVYDLTCSVAEAYLQEDFNKMPVLFGRVTGDDSCDAQEAEKGFNWPRVVIKTFQPTTSALDVAEEFDDSNNDSLNGMCQFSTSEPSPFSQQKSMYNREDLSHDPQDDTRPPDTHEIVMPGNKKEMQMFQEAASASTHLMVDVTLPVVVALLHSKQFYELLYNRVNNDLLMWEPAVPIPHFATESTTSSLGVNLSVQHLLNFSNPEYSDLQEQPRSAQFESDSESDESAPHYSIHDNKGKSQPAGRQLQSKICLSLSIGEGKLLACVPRKRDEGCHGELFVVLKDAILFAVTAYGGDPDLRYLCFQSNRAQLYHCDHVEQPVIPGKLEYISGNLPSHLKHRIYRSERGVPSGSTGAVGTGLDTSQDMVSVAVKTKLDTINNVKHFLISLAVRGSTLRHEFTLPSESWISQVIDFIDVHDFPIQGYTMPTILTELHVHLLGCAVDYRPLYLPLRAVVTAENVSLSSNLSTDASTSIRFMLESVSLFLSDKTFMEVNVKRDYICVANLNLFELAVHFGDGKSSKWPKTDLRLMAKKLELQTCSDSCKALIDLISYVLKEGDLYPEKDLQDLAEETPQERKQSNESLSESKLEHVHCMMEEAIREFSDVTTESELSEKTGPGTEVFFMTEDHFNRSPQAAPPAGLRHIVFSPSADSFNSTFSDQCSDADEDFCIIDDPGMGIAPRDGKPKVRIFTKDPIVILDNFFTQPLGKTDQLKAPSHYPKPDSRYTLRELSLVWYMYGGRDFSTDMKKDKNKPARPSSSERAFLPAFGSPFHSPDHKPRVPRTWQEQGGPLRDHDTLMELRLSKARIQYDVYPVTASESSRFALIVNEVEVVDHLKVSPINKFLYLYTSEKQPRQSSGNMVIVKALFSRPEAMLPTQDCSLKISLLPIRLNIDQESLFFLRRFFIELGGQQASDPYMPTPGTSESCSSSSSTPSSSVGSGSRERGPVLGVLHKQSEEEEHSVEGHVRPELLIQLDEISLERSQALRATLEQSEQDTGSDISSNMDVNNMPIFFKSVVFSPAVPIRLDYHGKCLHMDRTLAGLLIGLAQLNNSELCLKRLSCRTGLLGVEKVMAYMLSEWLTDIRANQLPSILGGVGPMYSFVQLIQGIRDMFWLPVEQYRRDGRVWRGVQRGASSISVSTARAIIELTNKAVGALQLLSELAYDMLSPGPSVRQNKRHKNRQQRSRHSQPTDLREGVSNAYNVICEGISDTAQELVRAATEEQEQKGMMGMVGGVLRQLPPTAVKPLIIATSATSNVLGGMRNQLCPQARKEEEEKWKDDH